MCGIFGVITGENSSLKADQIQDVTKDLFLLSESRGKEASGFAGWAENKLLVHKTPFPASEMVKTKVYHDQLLKMTQSNKGHFACIGHSRLVTNGYEHFNYNNQPVIKGDMVLIHNGIVVNIDDLWKAYPQIKRETDLDTEIIPVILQHKIAKEPSYLLALNKLYAEIYGMTNIAVFSLKNDNLILATNNGSIYYLKSEDDQLFIFASEYYILEQLIKKYEFLNGKKDLQIHHLEARTALSVSLNEAKSELKQLNETQIDFSNIKAKQSDAVFEEIAIDDKKRKVHKNTSLEHFAFEPPEEFVQIYEQRKLRIAELKRCSRCILPETFPYIEYDANGVCNYCNNYKKIDYKGAQAFADELNPYRKSNGKPELLMPFSGGRDSSYSLHYVVKELGMKPIAYSYDWGMITDLARRNQARMCDKLGVEHILVSADIRRKRENIRKNVLAWLKRPNLGTIPLFMAGDKQYFYFANLLMEQNKLEVSILGENLLETTKFKSGFCGIKPKFDKDHTYSLSLADKIKMLSFYGKEYLLNPAYLNGSFLDTLDAFKSYYVIKHRNINLFNFIRWDEKIVNDVLLNEYDWETDPGTKTTWRIGDGTAAFYNYIYFMLAGFTENDTFRSNQIREGDMTREEALERSKIENQPRWDSIKWYCNTINVDFENAINIINEIEPHY